jgi:hypothetical protein
MPTPQGLGRNYAYLSSFPVGVPKGEKGYKYFLKLLFVNSIYMKKN